MSARILVVDDNPLNVKLLTAKLTHDYYVVSAASSGMETLAKAQDERPDLILLDVMMPDMDGFATCKALRANPATAHIPVIMITALSDAADRLRGLDAGADDFLTKPINDIALMARVRSLLRFKMIMDEWRLREANWRICNRYVKRRNCGECSGRRSCSSCRRRPVSEGFYRRQHEGSGCAGRLHG